MSDKVTCPLCGGNWFRQKTGKKAIRYVQCRSCGFVLLDISDPSVSPTVYEKDYYAAWNLDTENEAAFLAGKQATFGQWIDKIERVCSGGRILDIGCAVGFFLDIARLRSWDVWGLEVSEYASQKARARFGDRITTGTLQQGHYKSEFFDAITAFDVVEHIGDPLPFIREIYRLLKPAGVFAVSTADIQSISARFMGSFWPHLKPEHVCFFSTTLLQATLEKAGFSIIYKGAARKKISLTYMQSYFAVFGFPFLSFVLKAFAKCLPKYLRSFPVTIPTGEIFIIAQK